MSIEHLNIFKHFFTIELFWNILISKVSSVLQGVTQRVFQCIHITPVHLVWPSAVLMKRKMTESTGKLWLRFISEYTFNYFSHLIISPVHITRTELDSNRHIAQ